MTNYQKTLFMSN